MIPFHVSAAVIERLGWVLLHSLWQFFVVALVVMLLLRVAQKRSALLRYSVLLLTLIGCVSLPVVTWMQVRPASSVMWQTSQVAGDVPGSIPVEPQPVGLPSGQRLVWIPMDAGDTSAKRAVSNPQTSFSPNGLAPVDRGESTMWESVGLVLRPWLPSIVGVWFAGVLIAGLRPLLSWYTVRRLRSTGVSAVSESIQLMLQRASERLRVRQTVQILQSVLVKVPIVVGYFKPVILLPVAIACDLPLSQLEAIVAHELAHVRRHDYLINLLQTLVETVFFYHPAIWWLSHQIRNERENCCDDIAAALMGNRVEYSRALLALEELRGMSTVLVVGANGGSLLARVRRLLSPEPVRRSSVFPGAGGLVITSMLLTAIVAVSLGFRDPNQARAQGAEPESSTETVAPDADGNKIPASTDFRGVVSTGKTPIVVTQQVSVTEGPPAPKPDQPAKNTKKTALRPAEFPPALDATFRQWDTEYRHKSEEKFLELEAVAEALAKKTEDRDQRAAIYAQVAHVAGQSTITKHVMRVRKFALQALELSRDPLQRTYMHSLVGSTYQIDETIKNVVERRRLAANSFVTGYSELLAYDIPEIAPELPAVGGGTKSEMDPAKREQQRLINEAQVKAWKQAFYMRDLVKYRNMLTDQLHWLYLPHPKAKDQITEGPAQLRDLAVAKLPDAAAVETLLSKVNQRRILNPEEEQKRKTAPGSVLDKLVSAKFMRMPIEEALARLCTDAGAALELDGEGFKTVGYTRNMPITIELADVSLKSALDRILGRFDKAAYTRVGRTIFVSTKERVANRERALQASLRIALERFQGDWDVVKGESKPDEPPKSLGPIRYQIQGHRNLSAGSVGLHTFSRLKNGASFGLGHIEVDPGFSPPTVVFQFEDTEGDAGYFIASYVVSLDNSIWLTIVDGDVHPAEDRSKAPAPGQVIRLVPAATDDPQPDRANSLPKPDARKAPSLEFRMVANAPESTVEPRLPPDYLQRHYRDVTKPTADPVKDKGFAWFPVSKPTSGEVTVAVERTTDKQRLGLLSDVPEHALLADEKWKITKCAVVPGDNGGNGMYSLQVTLDEAGGAAFRKLTKSHLNQQLAIVVGGTIVSAPTIRNEIGGDVMITGRFSKEEAEQLAATISPESWKQLFDCTIVDSATGKPIAGNGFTITFVFLKPASKDSPEEPVGNVIWGPKSGSQIKFVIPPTVLRHPDLEKLVVRWAVSHPDYETLAPPERLSVGELLHVEPKSAREALRQIKLTKKSTTKVWRIRAVDEQSNTPVADVSVEVRPWVKGQDPSGLKVYKSTNEGFVDVEIPEPGGAEVSIKDGRFFGATLEGLVPATEPKNRLGDVVWSNEQTWKATDDKQPLVLRCWHGTVVTGQLLQLDGQPAAGARLNVGVYVISDDWQRRLGMSTGFESWDHGQWPNWRTSAVTDAAGKFQARVPPGNSHGGVKVGSATLSFVPLNDGEIRKNEPDTVLLNYVPFQVKVSSEKAEVNSPLDCGTITLQRGVTLRGRVVDPQGNPVPGVRVTAEPHVTLARDSTDFSPFAGRVLLTDADGKFEFAPLHAGKVSLQVHGRGSAPDPKNLNRFPELLSSINTELPENANGVSVEIVARTPAEKTR